MCLGTVKQLHGVYYLLCTDAPSAPNDLIDVLEWARQSGFEWVRLDTQGDQVDVLPFYG